jgi:hypothetical protein
LPGTTENVTEPWTSAALAVTVTGPGLAAPGAMSICTSASPSNTTTPSCMTRRVWVAIGRSTPIFGAKSNRSCTPFSGWLSASNANARTVTLPPPAALTANGSVSM